MKKYVENCKHLNTCKNGLNRNCIGCNVYNVIYNYSAFVEWCKQNDKNVMTEHFNIIKNIMIA